MHLSNLFGSLEIRYEYFLAIKRVWRKVLWANEPDIRQSWASREQMNRDVMWFLTGNMHLRDSLSFSSDSTF